MTIPATLSVVSASIGLLTALLTLGMSSAPGWRELRWFSACAALAALFNLANIVVTLPVSTATLLFGSRLAACFGGFHTVAWFAYSSVQNNRPLSRFDRTMMSIGTVASIYALFPNGLMSDTIRVRYVPWLGVVYRDGELTSLGSLAFAFHLFGLCVLCARYAVRWKKGAPGAWTYCVALGAIVLCATSDSLTTEGVYDAPYTLDVALIVAIVAIGGSITSRFVASARALETSSRQLRLAQQELIKRERLAALGELAAVVAHEIRNPLGVIFNALSGLRRPKQDPADREELIKIVQEEAERIRGIVADLLEFARPRPLVQAPAQIEDVVRNAALAALRAANADPKELEVTVADNVSPVMCDEQLVRQAVINLVANALQAEGRKGPVHVNVGMTDSIVEIVVADDGKGIPDDLRERVFTPFYSTRATGTGLGLAVVRRTAEGHGGEATLSTTPGGGATFTLRIPCVPVPA